MGGGGGGGGVEGVCVCVCVCVRGAAIKQVFDSRTVTGFHSFGGWGVGGGGGG